MAFSQVAMVGELVADQMKRIEVNGQRLLLVFANDKYYAVDEMCSHEDYSLYLGCIQNGKIKCSLHGSYFDLENGQALVDPADEPIKTYPVKIENQQIWVDVE